MTDVAPLRLVGDDEVEEAPHDAGPTIFARTISTPAGMPWDQSRAAALEARLGAPLPLAEVVYRLWRLDAWSLGRPARYAACYVRAREIGDVFDTAVTIDGETVRVRILSAGEQRRRSQLFLLSVAGIASVALLVGLAVTEALATREEAGGKVASVGAMASLELREARALDRLKDQTRWLNAARVRGDALDDVLSDLAWASAAKAPAAHIDAIHWEHGLIGVQVRGDAAPFGQTDRAVTKVEKPLRPGVWLWGVGPAVGAPPVANTAPAGAP